MLVQIVLLGLGATMAIWPGHFSGLGSKRRQRRLLALEAGAPEKYFEERRQLQAYRPTPRTLLLWRGMGAVIALSAAVLLVIELPDQQAADAARAEARAAVSTARAAVDRAESLDPVAVAKAQAAVSAAEAAMARARQAEDEVGRLTGP